MTDAPLLDDEPVAVEETGVGDHVDHQPAPDPRQDIHVTTPLADRIDGLAAIETRRMKHGQNGDRRVPAEHLIIARSPT
mgnify:CR=1 FL=1